MGQLDQFAKQMFAEETEVVTHGAVTWQTPPEIGLSEVRLDGLLQVRDPRRLGTLAAPWSEAGEHDEIVVEVKMPGDHLDRPMLERTLLRRQARQVQRVEGGEKPWEGQEPLWMVAPHLPRLLPEIFTVRSVAPGCYRVGPLPFSFLWMAANELPLVDELIPFLVARSGRALDEFGRWIARRRPPAWVLRMVQIVPMTTSVRDDLMGALIKTDDPEILERQRYIARFMVNAYPEVRAELVATEVEKGLAHLFERRLSRPLADKEHQVLHERLARLGADRLGDVVLDLSTEALAAWLADPSAT